MAPLLASTTELKSALARDNATVFGALQPQLIAPDDSFILKQKPKALLLLFMFPAQSASEKFNKCRTRGLRKVKVLLIFPLKFQRTLLTAFQITSPGFSTNELRALAAKQMTGLLDKAFFSVNQSNFRS